VKIFYFTHKPLSSILLYAHPTTKASSYQRNAPIAKREMKKWQSGLVCKCIKI